MAIKLFYVPGTCSLNPHILLRETGLDFTLDEVDRKTKISKSGVDYNAINPKSYVPCIQDGELTLTENIAIVTYISNRPGAEKVLPASQLERAKLLEWLAYTSTEIHKNYSPLFRKTPDPAFRENLLKRLAFVEKHLEGGREFVVGDKFTAADSYLFTVLRWSPRLEVTLTPNLQRWFDHTRQRPSVQKAMEVEGLL